MIGVQTHGWRRGVVHRSCPVRAERLHLCRKIYRHDKPAVYHEICLTQFGLAVSIERLFPTAVLVTHYSRAFISICVSYIVLVTIVLSSDAVCLEYAAEATRMVPEGVTHGKRSVSGISHPGEIAEAVHTASGIPSDKQVSVRSCRAVCL